MKYRYIRLFFLIFFLFCLSCAGTQIEETREEEPREEEPRKEETRADDSGTIPADPPPELNPESPVQSDHRAEEVPAAAVRKILSGLVFHAGEMPAPKPQAGVGSITRDRRDISASLDQAGRRGISESFRQAYVDCLVRGVPLAGVLGGDEVHGWPPENPSAWAQNWHSAKPSVNSWGLPALILAVAGRIRPSAETNLNRVFIVQGNLLDFYGKNAGINGANGSAGYGAPRGNDFVLDGKIAQRFDFGLISIDREGKGAFLPENPPSLEIELPGNVGVFSGVSPDPSVSPAFVTAWKMAVDRGDGNMEPDAPGVYLPFLDSGAEGIYVQSFNRQSVLLVLPDSPGLPPFPRLVSSPFLPPLLRSLEYYVEGGENLAPRDVEITAGDEFHAALLRGFALYGLPLTDPVPVKGEDGSWREAQRFSRGWFICTGTEEQEVDNEISEPEAPVIEQP